MKAPLLGLLLTFGLSAILSAMACATPEYTYGKCAETDDCFTDINMQPDGSICKPADDDGVCTCPLDTVACCRDGEPGECVDVADCALVDRCPLSVECEQDLECPQPPDPQCGRGFCDNGRCLMEIHPGAIPSQRYGDCKRRECTTSGALLEVEDVGDFYDDANGCTQDMCSVGAPVNAPLANGITCPGIGSGYCYDALCVDCIAWMPAATSCGAGFACDFYWCEPIASCSGGACGGLCAPCPLGAGCQFDQDCSSGNCSGAMCQLPNCFNGKKDGVETDVDCGSCAALCGDGKLCTAPGHCSSGVCKAGKCQAPTCNDGTLNGEESGVDCGGSCGPC